MIIYGMDNPPEAYKDYKYRTEEKFRKRFKELLSGIESCSLKENHKKALLKEFSESKYFNQK